MSVQAHTQVLCTQQALHVGTDKHHMHFTYIVGAKGDTDEKYFLTWNSDEVAFYVLIIFSLC